jgi:signal transduction histidine kinase
MPRGEFPAPPPNGGRPIDVLSVAGDPDGAATVADALAGADTPFTVRTVYDPAAALDLVGDGRFDAVVTAYDLPTTDSDGLAVARTFRRDHPSLPIVVFTDAGSEHVASEAIGAGVAGYVPNDGPGSDSPDRLATCLRNAVDRGSVGRGTRPDADRACLEFDALFADSHLFAAILSPDGTVERVSETAARTVGVPADRCRGVALWEQPWWATPRDAEAVQASVDRAAAGETVQFRSAYRTDGVTRTALCLLLPVPADGTVRSILVLAQGVTEWARYEASLERQNRRLDAFATIVSHDLRSPLAVANGHLELAMRECDDDHLDHVDRALSRMGRLVDDLRTLAKRGEDIGATGPVVLGDLARAGWATVDGGDATLSVVGDLTFRADETRLRQLFENLFRNSVEHGSANGRSRTDDGAEHGSTRPGSRGHGDADPPTITVGPLSDPPGFFVEDDGPGIPPDEREAVFEAGHSTAPEGTGFGLKIVADIVAAHGWEVSVVTGSAGGARFEITGVDTDPDPDTGSDPDPDTGSDVV